MSVCLMYVSMWLQLLYSWESIFDVELWIIVIISRQTPEYFFVPVIFNKLIGKSSQ